MVLINLVAAKNKALMLNQATGLQFAAHSFDVSVWEIFKPFSMAERWFCWIMRSVNLLEALTDLIATQNVTHAFLPPALAGLKPTALSFKYAVRLLWVERPVHLISSPALPVVAESFMYGPTEATVCARLTAPLDADCDCVGTRSNWLSDLEYAGSCFKRFITDCPCWCLGRDVYFRCWFGAWLCWSF